MASITQDDIELLKDEASQISYGNVEMEFKNGVCVAISHKGRILTDKGKQARIQRNEHRRG